MTTNSAAEDSRIIIIDALRGSALAGILLLHAVEHWNFFASPDHTPAWLQPLDHIASAMVLFLFSGKAYGIFAMMFGISFQVILERWSKRGVNFNGRFVWRMALLALFGYLHGIIFWGDFLLVIALFGTPLLFVYGLSNRTLLVIAALLLLQLPYIWHAARMILQPGYHVPDFNLQNSVRHLSEVYAHGSFLDVCKTNLWTGQWMRLQFTIESGRCTQIMGLSICGLLIGRNQILTDAERSLRLGRHTLLWGVIGFAIFHPLRDHLQAWGLQGKDLSEVEDLITFYNHIALMGIWTGGFVLLFHWDSARRLLSLLAPYGRMSLTCYILQSLISVPLFYEYGLGLYHYVGPLWSLAYGAVFLVIQCIAAKLWLEKFHYGPLEWFWRSCTFLSFATPMKKAV